MYTINEAITHLQEDIEEKKKYIKRLEEFEELSKKGLSEIEYHDFCETYIRNSDLLGNALTVVFPFLKLEQSGINYYTYKIEGYDKTEIKIPSSRCLGINVYFKEYMNEPAVFEKTIEQQYLLRMSKLHKDIEICEKFIATNSVFEKAKLVFPHHKTPFNVINLLISSKTFNKKAYIDKLNNATEELKALQEYKNKDLTEKNRKYLEQQSFIEEFIPQFLKWTKTVYIYEAGWNRVEAVCRMRDGVLLLENNNY